VAKQSNRKKMKVPDIFGALRETAARYAATAFIIIVSVILAAVLVRAFLYRSDYFRLKVVETRAAFLDQRSATMISNRILDLYKAQNIFRIPLDVIARSVKASYADVKEAVVRIALPDRLVIDIKLRRPIAIAHNIKYYPVDEEGVVLPAVALPEAMSELPVIDGIDLRYGRKSSPRNLKLALELLREFRQSRPMAPYGIVSINAADPRAMSFMMKNGIEVRIGSENFKERLDSLHKTLKDPRLIVDRVKYIDVRFEDVAIGPK
jgi:cell division septal protein FtsQ